MNVFKKRDIKKAVVSEKRTLTNVEDFKGSPIIQIWEVDEDNQNVSSFPILSFGKSKARLVLKHIKDLEEFVK